MSGHKKGPPQINENADIVDLPISKTEIATIVFQMLHRLIREMQ
jgi:hypothetical protein